MSKKEIKDEPQVELSWIVEMGASEVDEVLRGSGNRKIEDPSTTLIYTECGLDTMLILWTHLPNLQLYISEKPLNELKRRYARKHFDPSNPRTCAKALAAKLKVCEKFIYDAAAVKRTEVYNTPSEVAGPHGEALIEQIIRGLGELDEIGRREILKYAIKKRNSSRSQNGNSPRRKIRARYG